MSSFVKFNDEVCKALDTVQLYQVQCDAVSPYFVFVSKERMGWVVIHIMGSTEMHIIFLSEKHRLKHR
jgi:hypothetical protein